MVFRRPGSSAQNPVWQIRGLVSVGLRGSRNCDNSNYAIFTDVSKYTIWIKSILSR